MKWKLVLLLAALGTVLVPGSSTARTVRESCAAGGASWLQTFGPTHSGSDVLRSPASFAVPLDYEDFGCVPKVVVTLYLPKGSRVVKQKVVWLSPGGQKSNSAFTRSKAGRPQWVYSNLTSNPMPTWLFSVSVPSGMHQLCVTAAARRYGVGDTRTQTGKDCRPEEL